MINELLATLNGQKYFTVIDLKDVFFQVPIRKEDREKPTFATEEGLFQLKVMPQSYKNSPAIFQRGMSIMLKGLINNICIGYIDDILIFGKSKESHDFNWNAVLKRLKEYGMIENNEKRIYMQEEVKFLGYRISYNSIKPSLDRAQAIIDYKTPTTKKELQRFLGIVN